MVETFHPCATVLRVVGLRAAHNYVSGPNLKKDENRTWWFTTKVVEVGVKKIYENGLNEQEDIEQLEITLGNLNSQLNSVKRMKGIAYKMLNLSIGNPIETELTLTDTLDSLVKNNTV